MLTNNFRRFVLAFMVTAAVVLSLTMLKPTVTAQTSINLAQKAKAEVSRTIGMPVDNLTIGNQASLADTDIKRFKVIDSQGKTYSIALDAAGNAVSQEVVEQAIEAFNNRGFVGKLEVALDNLLKEGSDKPIRVIFWLKEEPTAPTRGGTPDEREANLNQLKSRYAAIEQPIVEQLRANGQEVIYQSPYAPIVGASVTSSVIQMIAAHPDVERIYLEKAGGQRLNISRGVVQANTVNSRGLTGLVETVGIVEAGRIGTHPNLPQTQRSFCNSAASTSEDTHKTFVAGVIQSTSATYKGIAPDINIVDGVVANGIPTMSLMETTDCVINSASATNMSFFDEETNGEFNAFARYVDKVVYETGATIVVAASDFCENKSGSPDIAFNIINVGSFGDNNTTTFADDIVPCTGGIAGSYLNPNSVNMDREEPDVVAPGVNIRSTKKDGGFENAFPPTGGTSFAAPHVTAGVGLLRSRKIELFNRPAEVRAIIMASARHNLEGASRLSDKDGAGGVLLAAADTVVANGQSDHIINDGSASNFPILKTFTAISGQKVRVVIAWDHKMPLGEMMSEPTTDLDLEIYCNSTSVGSSRSYDNNYEIVEFTAVTCPTGYTAKIFNFRPSSGDEEIGFAISKTDN